MSKKFQEIINSDKPTLVDFYADWCQPCQMMKPILVELKEKMGDAVQIIKIDTEKNQELSAKLQIRSIPTLMIYQRGEVKWRHSGVMNLKELESQIHKIAN